MRECIKTDRPLISIVMAVYNPNMKWFKEQLASLDAQDYGNLELVILDDCSDSVDFDAIKECVAENVTKIPCSVSRNERNLGSNKTFERLTLIARGEYIAYCDQDDVWKENKLTALEKHIARTDAELVYSDAEIMDADGNFVANSITRVRKRHVFHSGEGLAKLLLHKNFVTGCTMLVNAKTAREAVPFIDSMVHDHYLALYCACKGKIEFLRQSLVRYRIHANNQTGVMTGVSTKEDYFKVRIMSFFNRINDICGRFEIDGAQRAAQWARARIDYCEGKKGSFAKLWKLKGVNPLVTIFELIMLKAPESLFLYAIRLIQWGIL